MMRNDAVVFAFSRGEPARAGRLWTDGRSLYSYNLMIARRTPAGIVVGDFTAGGGDFYSVTTSRHVGLACRVADTVMLPEIFKGAVSDPNEIPF